MKKSLTLIVVCFITINALAKNPIIASLSGKVLVKSENSAVYLPAKAGTQLGENETLETGTDGKALLTFPNKIQVWIAPSGSLEITKSKWSSNRVKVLSGKIKFSVPQLKRKETFEIESGKVIYSTGKGDFIVETGSGLTDLRVIFGQVKIKTKKSSRLITQGLSCGADKKGRPGKILLLTKTQELDGLADWSPQLKPAHSLDSLKNRLKSRLNVKTFAFNTHKTETKILAFTNRIKQSDMESGRTLKDIHGNLVRVEQRLLRPSADTIQMINLIKRPRYTNTAGNFTYNGGVVINRLDAMQVRLEFNKNLPHNLSQWSGFFDKQDVIVKRASLVMSDHTNPGSIYAIGFLVNNKRYDPSTDTINTSLENKLEKSDKFYFGTINKTSYNKLADFQIDTQNGLMADGSVEDLSSAVLSGLAWAQKPAGGTAWDVPNPPNPDIGQSLETSGDDDLYKYKVNPYCVAGNCTPAQNRIWLAQEYYVTNNNGKILNAKDITDSKTSVPLLAENIAGQMIFYVKNDTGAFEWFQISDTDTNLNVASNFTNPGAKNIYLLLIPDLAYQSIEKIFSVIDNISYE
jgi:hypothetical protein